MTTAGPDVVVYFIDTHAHEPFHTMRSERGGSRGAKKNIRARCSIDE